MLPDDDRDLQLSRRIGTLLEEGKGLQSLSELQDSPSDALPEALNQYKARRFEEAPASQEAQAQAWSRLVDHLDMDTPPHPFLRLVRRIAPRRRTAPAWIAVAATMLVLVLVRVLMPEGPEAPMLVARAETEQVVRTLDDGTTVMLRPHSALYALPSDTTNTRYRLEGEGFFDVTKDATRTFSVAANDALVAVLGTRFNVSTWGAQTVVYLESGRVRFHHEASGQAVELDPGERAVLTAEGRLMDPAAAAAEEYVDWMRGEMVFSARPLIHVLDELAQHFGVHFEVPGSLEQETLSGRILLESRAQSINDLAVVLGGRFVQIHADTYRFESP